jgi:hypothetical protein
MRRRRRRRKKKKGRGRRRAAVESESSWERGKKRKKTNLLSFPLYNSSSKLHATKTTGLVANHWARSRVTVVAEEEQ